MDFSNRDAQQPQSPAARSAAGGQGSLSQSGGKRNKRDRKAGEWWRLGTVLVVAAIAVLIAAVIVVVIAGGDSVKAEDKYVDTNKLQAVFLNTGQVYFGHVQSLNDKYFVVNDIYYLQATSGNGSSSSASTSGSNVTLVKLGCELHRPYDQMVINSDQVTFWENLQSDGQVAKAVSTFQQQNPNGQKCADQSSSAPTTSGSTTQNAPASSTPAASNKH